MWGSQVWEDSIFHIIVSVASGQAKQLLSEQVQLWNSEKLPWATLTPLYNSSTSVTHTVLPPPPPPPSQDDSASVCVCAGVSIQSSVEEDWIWVSVGHLRHVFKNVLFSDDSQQTPVLNDEALPQAELAEDVHYVFHGRVHSDRKGAEVQDAAQLDRRRSTGWHGWITFSEQDGRHADHTLLMPPCIF